ncbi:TonB-dependent receptor [Flavobacteriales bacterium]|nr:TonB-dependent receptor [Flavobacteriales bacterium]
MKNLKLCILLILPFILKSQESNDSIIFKQQLNEVNINALRAGEKTPVSFTNINKDQIIKSNLGLDLPYIISLSPSIVTTSDAGAGIGYTGFRIRGTDPTRINVTINGIPLNDSESQGVWWVNMPDFSSSIDNIQIQRGVGTSTNGSGAFGASVNLQTNKLKLTPNIITSNTVGSYNTLKNNIEFGTGLINNNFIIDTRISRIASDGYIDRASANLKSIYLEGTYLGEKSVLKALIFSGQELTYQAWNGVPLNYLDTNRTFNSYTYENEVDNYQQTHYQLHYSKQSSESTKLKIAYHFTHGEGYYEQEKLSQKFNDYGLDNIIISADTIFTTNLVRRKWLKNDFGGITYSIDHNFKSTNLILGGSYNKYSGQHYGNIIWAQYSSNGAIDHQYYWNKAEKYDQNMYLKVNYNYSTKTNIYADFQNRKVDYTFEGKDENNNVAEQNVIFNFNNPKIGLFHTINKNQSLYISYAVANREPNRNDFVESTPKSRPIQETLYDTEIGYKYLSPKLNLSVNLYQMNYDNQLVLTGQINDVGANTRVNIDKSFRKGIEIEANYKINTKINWSGNISFSENKIIEHTAYIDNWDTGDQETIDYKNTDLAFSPNRVYSSIINYKFDKNTELDFISKFVGKQYIDNTSSKDRMLKDYLVNNIRFTYFWNSKIFKSAKFTFQVNNIFDLQYVSNAWIYRFISENWDPRDSDPYVNADSQRGYNMAGYFPEATRNYLAGLTIEF